ncbi:MAG: serine/threonine-protein kinase [Verrucomicrobiales bacterium]|nr:serine/threonine-protein kinase [Verrucomicrobiales bacterium]
MENALCPTCGYVLSESVAGGLCPKCILGSATPEDTAASQEKYFRPDGKAKVVRDRTGIQFQLIGPYRLREALGKGGMGEVWAARQEYPVERDVALKIVRPGTLDSALVERFRAESRTLAIMSHPNIVRLYEVGETESGEPFFAMEIVSGEPIVEFCDARQLSIRARLLLMLGVARAVEHAHRHGIIHRDLKPDNILVSVDREGNFVPKLIDFGIAKTLEEKWPGDTLLTLDGQVLGTPQYMSPEQAEGGEVETRSDVFGLGTVLYELLTGDPPLAAAAIAELNIENLLRLIREHEAERPSIRVQTSSGKDREGEAANHSTTFERWPKKLRDELDWIALRCIEKAPSRRYDSAGLLADDLQRYLDGEPVLARPPSRVYRARKFARKHKALVFSALSIFCILLIATSVSVKWAIEATEAEELAQARLADADAVPDFLFEAFRQASPQNGGAEMLALDVLREAESKVTLEFSSQPVIRARIEEAIATTYNDLGRPDLAAGVFEKALNSAKELPENTKMVQRLTFLLNGANRASGRAEKALLASRDNWKTLSESLGEDDSQVHKARLNHCRNLLEAAYSNDEQRTDYLNEVEDTLKEVLHNPERFPGMERQSYLAVLAQHATGSGNHESAFQFWNEDLNRHFFEGRFRHKGHYWPMSFLLASLRRTDRLEEATAAAEQLFLHCHDFYGSFHSNTTDSARYLAGVYEQRGMPMTSAMICQFTALNRESIDPLFEKNVESLLQWAQRLKLTTAQKQKVAAMMTLISTGNGAKAISMNENQDPGKIFWLGELLWNSGEHDDGIILLEKAYRKSVTQYGAEHPIALTRGNRYAQRCIESEKLEIASKILTPPLFGEAHTWRNGPVLEIALNLAEHLQAGENYEAANRIATEVIAIHIKNKGKDEQQMDRCSRILTAFARKQKDPRALSRIHEKQWHSFVKIFGENHAATLYQRIRSVDCLIGCGEHEEALSRIDEFLKDKGPRNPQNTPWRISRARCFIGLEQFDEAENILLSDWNQFQSDNTTEKMHPEFATRMRYRISDSLAQLYEKWSRPAKSDQWKEISTSLIPAAR